LIPTHLGADANPQEEIFLPHPCISSAEVIEDILFLIEYNHVKYRKKVRRNKMRKYLSPIVMRPFSTITEHYGCTTLISPFDIN